MTQIGSKNLLFGSGQLHREYLHSSTCWRRQSNFWFWQRWSILKMRSSWWISSLHWWMSISDSYSIINCPTNVWICVECNNWWSAHLKSEPTRWHDLDERGLWWSIIGRDSLLFSFTTLRCPFGYYPFLWRTSDRTNVLKIWMPADFHQDVCCKA